MRKWLESKKADKNYSKIEADLQKIEEKYNIKIYARLISTTEIIEPVLTFDNITK
uniref:Uncharacterized protein n=1 Tax=viral metagenome TaxID=1070528 RepID=A0A6M3J2D5_9ZZZZ